MDDLDAYINAASTMAGVEIADAHRPGVRAFLTIAKEMADAVEAAPLERSEFVLAPVYLPSERGDE
jgi:hypothetical protein